MSFRDFINGDVPDTDNQEDPYTLYSDVVELAKTGGTGQTQQSERTTEEVGNDKLRKLYKTDPLTYRIVEEYKAGIVTEILFDKPQNKKDVDFCNEWAKRVNLKQRLVEIIQDILLGGNGWFELVVMSGDPWLTLKPINPDTMDFIRNATANNQVDLDEKQSPVGYIQSTTFHSTNIYIYWMKDQIIKQGTKAPDSTSITGDVILQSKGKEDLRTRIAHLKLWGWGDSWLGTTPLASSYKSAIIRLNISDVVGEAAFRGGGLLAKVPKTATPDSKKNLREQMRNLTTKNLMLVDSEVELDNIPTTPLDGKDKLMYAFADEFASGMMTYLPLIMTIPDTSISAGERDELAAKFEMYLQMLREIFAAQLKETVMTKLWEVSGRKGIPPEMKFSDRSQITMLNLSRVIATLARRNLITRDPELELRFREAMGLPTKFVKLEEEKWDKEGGPPQVPVPSPDGSINGKEPKSDNFPKPGTVGEPDNPKKMDKQSNGD